MVNVSEISHQVDYLETNGPLFYKDIADIPESNKSYLLKDDAILHCLERVISLGFYK